MMDFSKSIEDIKNNLNKELNNAYEIGFQNGWESGQDEVLSEGAMSDMYNCGLEDAWELIKVIEDLPEQERMNIFHVSSIYKIVRMYTPDEVMSMLDEYISPCEHCNLNNTKEETHREPNSCITCENSDCCKSSYPCIECNYNGTYTVHTDKNFYVRKKDLNYNKKDFDNVTCNSCEHTDCIRQYYPCNKCNRNNEMVVNTLDDFYEKNWRPWVTE